MLELTGAEGADRGCECVGYQRSRHRREVPHAAPRIISHELPLEQASEGHRNFDARDGGWTKVVLKPAA
ncbi:hypothetical protein [Burkholderia gladioli]|uniref:hypothetical protein n=1 Tax=Burkholderia gladioli TaxID=28095 RepID=UPI000B280576|nr:hypothetical protein [Burkholderia gladioli]